jgi:beta-glucanase (GH16 family)
MAARCRQIPEIRVCHGCRVGVDGPRMKPLSPYRLLMPRHVLPIAVLSLLAACAGGGSAPVSPPPDSMTGNHTLVRPAHYRLVWADEFDQPGLPDPARWEHDTFRNRQGWFNEERQYYSDRRLENSEVRDGRLVITARLESLSTAADWGGQKYTSARLLTRGKAQWTYGFFEARAKLPCGVGTWPAIWTLGVDGEWPAGGELDILEHVGRDPQRVFSAVHTPSNSGANGKSEGQTLTTACSQFHNYQMHWTPDGVRFGVDGRHHFTYPNAKTGAAQWPFNAPQFMLLNLAIGGHLGGPVDDSIFPVKFEIDYVRVYQAR